MKTLLTSALNSFTFQILLAGVLFVLAGCALWTGLVALCIYVHPVAALVAFCVLVVVLGEFFDHTGD